MNDFGGPVKGMLQVGKFRNFAYGISPTGPDVYTATMVSSTRATASPASPVSSI